MLVGLGQKTRYVRREENEQPCFKFIDNTQHPEQLMIIAVVGRPDPSKGFDGKVYIDFACAEWVLAQRASSKRPAGTWEIKPEKKEDGSPKGVSGETYKEQMVEFAFPKIRDAAKKLGPLPDQVHYAVVR